MAQPDYSSLPPPPTTSHRGRESLAALAVVVVMLALGSLAGLNWMVNAGVPGPFVCPTDMSSKWVNENGVGAASSVPTPSQPPPGSAIGLAQSLTPSLVTWPWEPPSQWTATPTDDKASSPFSYFWGTSALGNPDLSGTRTGDVSVELYGSAEARLTAEQDQSIEAKATGNTWTCFADCGPVLVSVKVAASKVPGVRGSDEFHNSDRIAMADLTVEAQLALNKIYGGCPVPEYVNKNKPE